MELQHILDYHMLIPQVQVALPGQDQILPQAFMVDNLMVMLELHRLRSFQRPSGLWIFLPFHYLHPKARRCSLGIG